VLLVARSEDKLAAICNELGREHGVNAQYVVMDLTDGGAAARVFEETAKRGLEVETLINNAGFGSMGDFATLDLETELKMIDLNIRALVDLTYRFLAPMRERRRGWVINVASTAGFQPVPFMTTYAATKAFVLSFSIGLWEENRPYDVQVMALCPGVTETNFFEAAHIDKPPMRGSQTPEQVVETAMRGMKRGKSHIISGWSNYLMTESERLVPRSLVARAVGAALRPRYQKKVSSEQ
jgi:short-subunit dehydrogenase